MPSTIDIVKLWFNANGTPVVQRNYPEAASQSGIRVGDPVYLVSGAVTAAASTGANVGAVKLLGIALKDGSGTTGNLIPVAIYTDDLRWVLPCTTSAVTIGTGAATAATQVGLPYEISRVAAGKITVDINANTNAMVVVESIHAQYGVFNTNAGVVTGVGSTESGGWLVCKPYEANWDTTA